MAFTFSPVAFTFLLSSNPVSLSFKMTRLKGEGNGNPLQCSCMENPMDREACWAAVYGVSKSWT